MGGNLSFDSSALEYVSGTGASSPYSFEINTGANYKIAGLDTSLNKGINSNTTIFTFVFKPLKTGATTISFKNGKLTDTSGEINTSYNALVVNVTEKLNDDTSLSKLSVDGYSLTPEFNSKVTSYQLSVPFDVDRINVNATANNEKSKVKINGAINLISEETRDVEIVVTSESGSHQKYIIRTTRGKDPNKPLESNNNLIELTPSIGILSPVFNKDIDDYIIYLPYEVENIDFTYRAEDEKYGKVDVVGDKNLKAGESNVFKINVTAEDKSVKTYTINVKRANVYGEQPASSSVFLKSITIKNGTQIEFDKNVTSYKISKDDGFKISYELEDETAIAHKIEDENNIYIIVESLDGNFNVYHLQVTETNYLVIVVIVEALIMVSLLVLNIKGINLLKIKR